ncbi:hypothetical protein FRC00_001656 [Tulasnella sp. 408]|nr:hypothetical protein FRC00_001656 [Tulasnella sp. 408]
MILEIASRLWMQLYRLVRRACVHQATSGETARASFATPMDDWESLNPDLPFRINSPVIERAPTPQYSGTRQDVEAKEQIVTAQAACWLLQTTSIRADQVAVARFIRSLTKDACSSVFEDPGNWRRLLSLTSEALDLWDSQPTEGNRELAEAFGLALCYVPLPLPEDLVKGGKDIVFDPMPLQKASSLGEAFLHALDLASAKYEAGDEECIFHLAFLFTLLIRGRMVKEYQWANLSKLFLVGENPRPRIADSLLGMWAYAAFRSSGGSGYKIRKSEELMEIGDST